MTFKAPNQFRLKSGQFASKDEDGNNGAFYFAEKGYEFFTIASDGAGWDHVSVSINRPRTPSWEQMCFVKNLFWSCDETVVQFHPRIEDYVNCAPNCLHLWKPQKENVELPPSVLVGPK